MKFDLNCDLGEGEPLAQTRGLMRWITSANVACGGHAGNLKTMEACVHLAKQFGVHLGAHPGPWSRGDFGRGVVRLQGHELELLLLQQVGGLQRIASAHDRTIHHIKLHGSLYHASEADASLARRYVMAVRRWWPAARIYAKAAGKVARIAQQTGVQVWEEVYLDRAYSNDGSLVPRHEPGAVLTELAFVIERAQAIAKRAEVLTIGGKRLSLRPQTLCVHSDTPNAKQSARAVAGMLSISLRSS